MRFRSPDAGRFGYAEPANMCISSNARVWLSSRSYSAVWSISRRPAMHGAVVRWWHSVTGPGGYAVEEELLDHCPAAHARRPRSLSRGLRPVVTRARLGVSEDRV